jgi:hypothetical protein
MLKRTAVLAGTLVLVLMTVFGSSAATTFFGPAPYLSADDIPQGLYLNDMPAALEDFEDGQLDFGIIASSGYVAGPSQSTDSVDADDGVFDSLGNDGHSWTEESASEVLFTFPSPVTAAGLVWTDGVYRTDVTFEAFGPGMVSLGTVEAILGDTVFNGTT